MEHGLSLGRSFFKGHGHGNDYLVFEEGGDWPLTSGTVREVCHRWRGPGGDGIVALLGPREEEKAAAGAGGAGGSAAEPVAGGTPHAAGSGNSLGEPAAGGSPAGAGAPGDGGPGSSSGQPAAGGSPAGAGSGSRPVRLRMFNPDGSEFERSGNGLRVLGAYLFARGRAREGRPFPVEVGGDRVHMEVLRREPGGLLQVAVEMGRGRAGGAAVGWREEEAGDGGRLRGPGGEGLDAEPFSVGNPHCVVFRGELRDEDLLRLGPHLTRHPAFPEGINVQLARVRGEGRVEILIWERGVGRTSSSGTSACAVAGACVHRGLLEPGRVEVVMEGGSFFVTVSPELELRLEGPVRPIMTGELTDEMLETLRAGPSGPSWRES